MEESAALAELADRLRGAVAQAPGGILPFEDFMRRALYEPELGYYERGSGRVGRDGDFYTSVSVGSLFGELLGHQLADWLGTLDSPPCLVESGAHDARLAGDILAWLETSRPALFESLTYWLVEPSPARESWQRERLARFGERVRWTASIPRIQGIHFSNELLDAFPVRPVRWSVARQDWEEVGVVTTAGSFHETPFQRRSDTPIPDLPAEVLAVLPDGFTTEFSPAAEAWWSQAATQVTSGYLLAIDYGLTAEEFLVPQRARGTRRGYRHHRWVEDLLAHPGDCDLTAHVNFTRIQTAGERQGWHTERLADQRLGLTDIFRRVLTEPRGFGEWTPARQRQFQTLTHPEHLGRSFRWLVQSRRP